MRITIAAIGRLQSGPMASLVDDYAERIRRGGAAQGIADISIVQFEAPKALAGERRQEAEGDWLTKTVGAMPITVALDERGKHLTSANFADQIRYWRDDGVREIGFAIGGADGLSPTFRSSADLKIAFGAMTWPHMLARVMLCEQLYRATTILSGHPYHRA